MDVQIDLVRENPEVGRLYHLTCSNGRTFEVGLQYQQVGSLRLVSGWLDGQDFKQPGKQWSDPDEALRDITDHIRELCQQES